MRCSGQTIRYADPVAKFIKLLLMAKVIDVVGEVFLRDGHVFAARRGPGKSMAGKWQFPGGKFEPGEKPESALARELREELKIEAGSDST